MADMFSPEKRSEIMSRIRSKNTKAELIAFRYLRKKHLYFQKHYLRAPGKPDIALPRKKIAVFIDGDFWHGRHVQRLLARQGENSQYWIPKIQSNIDRDRSYDKKLNDLGWKVMRVWASDLERKRTAKVTLESIENFLIQSTQRHNENG